MAGDEEYSLEEYSLDYDLRLDDFIEQLVATPNFKYSYTRMWLRGILTEWAVEVEAADLFVKGVGQDILPMWFNYVVQKLRTNEVDDCAQLCELMQHDIKFFYANSESGDWKCLRQGNVEKLLRPPLDEVEPTFEEASIMSEDSKDEDDYSYQVFITQFQYLISLIENTFSTRFKFLLFSMNFRKTSESQPTKVIAPYMLHLPKKYLASKSFETSRMANVTLQAGLERVHQFTTSDMSSDEDGVLNKQEKAVEVRPASMIMPLSQASNVDSAFWDSQRSFEAK